MPDLSIVTLADIARALMEEHMGGAVADPLPRHVRDALGELTEAIKRDIENGGVDAETAQQDADYAVTRWMIEELPIERCIELEQTEEARAMRKPERRTQDG